MVVADFVDMKPVQRRELELAQLAIFPARRNFNGMSAVGVQDINVPVEETFAAEVAVDEAGEIRSRTRVDVTPDVADVVVVSCVNVRQVSVQNEPTGERPIAFWASQAVT